MLGHMPVYMIPAAKASLMPKGRLEKPLLKQELVFIFDQRSKSSAGLRLLETRPGPPCVPPAALSSLLTLGLCLGHILSYRTFIKGSALVTVTPQLYMLLEAGRKGPDTRAQIAVFNTDPL